MYCSASAGSYAYKNNLIFAIYCVILATNHFLASSSVVDGNYGNYMIFF